MSNPNAYYPFSTGVFEGLSGDGRWKLHLPHSCSLPENKWGKGNAWEVSDAKIGLSLFDLGRDPYESQNVYDDYPDVAQRLEGLAKSIIRGSFQKP